MPKLPRDDDDYETDLDSVPLDEIENGDILVDGKYFQGNENILRQNATFKWSDDMIAELKLCAKSILHFAEHHFYITTLDEGKKKIELYKYQKKLLKAFKSNRFNIVLSSRQSGKTTTITIYALWLVCFQADKRVTIIANKESTAKEVFARIRMAYEQLPVYLKPSMKSWRKDGFLLANDSAITISTTSAAGPRGSSSNLLIIDEMAHCPTELMKELWKSAIPIISSSKKSQIVAISTPNGTDNKFYDLYEEALKKNSEWNLERVDWNDVPGRDEAWRLQTIASLGSVEDFEQEFGNAFILPGKSVVDLSYLDALKAQSKDPILVNDNGFYKIYELPKPGDLYIIGVDVGEGIGRSNTVAQILNVTNLQNIKQAAVYATNSMSPFHFGTKLMSVLTDWGRPPILIENNNNGQQVLDVLCQTHQYENVVSYQFEGNSKHYNTEKRLGIHNHTNTRYKGIANFRYWINGLKVVGLSDIDTILELYNFVRLPNFTYSKRSDKDLDDRIFGLIWALFILDPSLVTRYFVVSELDDQGRPLKIQALYDNSDIISKSPLLIGGEYSLDKNKRSSALPSLMPTKEYNGNAAFADEANDLWRWLHTQAYTEKDKFRKNPDEEDKSSIEEYRPITLF
jgi:hypothetical protein